MHKTARALNGNGAAAKRAAHLWWRRQLFAQGVYGGPLRLLGYIVAIGVPLAAYNAMAQGQGGWLPWAFAVGAPVLVLGLAWLRHRHESIKQPQVRPQVHWYRR